MTASLRLYEELVLLGLHNEKGKLKSMWVPHVIAVSVIAELGQLDRIELGHRPANFVSVVDSTPVDDDLMDAVLRLIDASPEPKRLREWMLEISGTKELLPLAAERLVEDQVLSMNVERALLVLKRTTFPVLNPEPEDEVVNRLWNAIFDHGHVDRRTALLVGLAHSSGLLRLEFGDEALAEQRERIDAIVTLSDVNLSISEALETLSGSAKNWI